MDFCLHIHIVSCILCNNFSHVRTIAHYKLTFSATFFLKYFFSLPLQMFSYLSPDHNCLRERLACWIDLECNTPANRDRTAPVRWTASRGKRHQTDRHHIWWAATRSTVPTTTFSCWTNRCETQWSKMCFPLKSNSFDCVVSCKRYTYKTRLPKVCMNIFFIFLFNN